MGKERDDVGLHIRQAARAAVAEHGFEKAMEAVIGTLMAEMTKISDVLYDDANPADQEKIGKAMVTGAVLMAIWADHAHIDLDDGASLQ